MGFASQKAGFCDAKLAANPHRSSNSLATSNASVHGSQAVQFRYCFQVTEKDNERSIGAPQCHEWLYLFRLGVVSGTEPKSIITNTLQNLPAVIALTSHFQRFSSCQKVVILNMELGIVLGIVFWRRNADKAYFLNEFIV